MRRRVRWLVGVLAVAAAVWLLWPDGRDAGGVSGDSGPIRNPEGTPSLRGAAAREGNAQGATGAERAAQPRPAPATDPALFQFRLRIVSPAGEPAAGCEVFLLRKEVPPRARGAEGNRIPLVRSDGTAEDGVQRLAAGGEGLVAVALPLQDPAAFWLWVIPSAQPAWRPTWVDGAALRSGEVTEVRLESARPLEVEVIDAEGRPVDGAQVGIMPLAADRVAAYAMPGEPTMGSWSQPLPRDGNQRRFLLPEAGALRVSARKRGYARAFAIVPAGEDRVTLTLLQPKSLIRIELEDAARWPGAIARLQLDDPRYGAVAPQATGQAAFRDGVCRFEDAVGPGSYRVRVSCWDATPEIVRGVRITADRPQATVRVRLKRSPKYARLLLTWARDGPALPQTWTRTGEGPWRRSFLIFATAEGMEIRMLPPGAMDVVLLAPDGSGLAWVPRPRLRGGEDTTRPAAFEPFREFGLPEKRPEPQTTTAVWIEDERGRSLPVLVHVVRRAGVPPGVLLPGAPLRFQDAARFQVPARSATLCWRVEDGAEHRLALVPLVD